MKVLALLSNVLGNKTFSNCILESLAEIPDVDVHVISLSGLDYSITPAPRYIRFSGSLESEWVFKQKLLHLGLPKEIDVVVANGLGLLKVALPFLKTKKFNHCPPPPLILATDTTPELIFQQKNLSEKKWKRLLERSWHQINNYFFLRMARQVSIFLPRASWCAQSLENDYHLTQPKIVISSSQKNILETLPFRSSKVCKFLFVGNDFLRKGGDILLDAWNDICLREKQCELTIISNDPFFNNSERRPRGVKLIQGIKSLNYLLPFYREANVQILPTRMDQYPNVICEGFSQGLPIIASDVGGISELVNESKGGILVPPNSPKEVWIKVILDFINLSLEQKRALEQNALDYAQQRMSSRDFTAVIKLILKNLSGKVC